MSAILQKLVSSRRSADNDTTSNDGASRPSNDVVPTPRPHLPHSATLAPHLSSSASLKEFSVWR
ncbi:hypothetical protein E2C01_041714 [Portunus trituberculatus]|uniref:Uncharacterized protein n=1 Tax=Portunus trituberculatus TaxID=210409 RepID=A0A5B7FSG3_PORTR|nr:hypothetical protein [Portunus trituberculatus]